MNKKLKTFLGIVSILILTIILHYTETLQPLENSIRTVINPTSEQINKINIKIKGNTESFSNAEELQQAYEETKEKLIEEKVERSQLELAQKENKKLRKELNFLNQREYKYISSNVVGKNIEQIGNTLVINVGSDNGVKSGQPAIVEDGVLVGKVAKVNDKTSVVRLLHDSQSKVAATILNKNESIGLIEGGFGINIKMNYIPQNEKIDVSDEVITSGLSQNIPRGLLIGTVEAVEKEPYQPFQRAVIKPPVDLHKVSFVTVITSYKNGKDRENN